MNAGGTMLRVYDTLKEQIMAGAFAPGDRLDPARLADDLVASTSPVRDALNRLTGERMVENPHHEGFRQPHVTEAQLRNLYEWSQELCLLIVTAAARSRLVSSAEKPLDVADPRECARQLFGALALASPNLEHRAAMASVIDRLALFRAAEAISLPGNSAEARLLRIAMDRHDWHALRVQLKRYHRRRVRGVAPIMAAWREP